MQAENGHTILIPVKKGCALIERIQQTARLLAARFSPRRLILFSRKTGLDGETASFKLCMVAELADKREAQREIFRQAEDSLPFEVLIYTPREWSNALEREDSFARKIERMGRDLLG